MTLNMVRRSRINPRLSAYQQIWGNYDFTKHPMGIAGCKTITHLLRPKDRPCFSVHGIDGFYIEPDMESFRNFICYIPSTRDTRKSNTVQFFPRHTQMPETSSTDRLAAVVEDLINILQNPHPPTPFLQKGDPTNDAIKQLRIIFKVPTTAHVTDNNRPNNLLVTNPSVPRVIPSVPRVGQPPPRVRTAPTTTHRRARVEARRMAPISEEQEVFPLGTTVRKKFNRFTHIGKIIKYDKDQGWYTIEYQDGDWEEMNAKEVSKYKCTVDVFTIDNVCRLTRSSRAAALSAFKAVNNNDAIITNDRVIPKGCVNAVFDEETKTMMEIKALINHKIW